MPNNKTIMKKLKQEYLPSNSKKYNVRFVVVENLKNMMKIEVK